MASALGTRDHFKDVSTEDTNPLKPFMHNQSRQDRLPILESTPSLTFGSSFGVGNTMWNSASNIWRPTSKFVDTAADSVQQDTSTANKSGSKSLLLSSELEAPPIRSKIPWGSTLSTNHVFASRSQEHSVSPLRPRPGEVSGIVQRVGHSNGLGANKILPAYGYFQGLSTTSTQASNGLRHQPDMSAIDDNLTAAEGGHSIAGTNYAAFRTNGVSSVTQTPRPFQRGNGELRDAPYQHHAMSSTTASGFEDVVGPGNLYQASTTFDRDAELFSPSYGARVVINRSQSQFNDEESTFQLPQHTYAHHGGIRSSYQNHSKAARAHATLDERGSAPNSAHSEIFQNYGNRRYSAYSRSNSFGDHTNTSPAASDYRHSFHSPFYSNSGTPPTGPESLKSASNSGISSRASHGYGQSFERSLQDRDYQSIQLNPVPSNFGHHLAAKFSSYPGSMRMNPLANPYTVPGYLNLSGLPTAPRFQLREPEQPQVMRSPLLEEFRMNNKSNKRYELRDIYNHVVEFSGDQHGSRFIQQKLETANSDEKDQIFTEMQPNSLQLMTDVFGNYVIQKLFEHGNQSQKKALANQMKGHVLSLSTQMYGCRVVQKALEHVLTDQQASIVKELESHVLKCVKDQNGNHVIQKAIERVPAEHIQFIIGAFTDQVQRLATHPYGCRVIQRMLEHCEEPARKSILQELHPCIPRLITDQFGNYVIQHVIENGEVEDKHGIVVVVLSQLLVFSKHKFASNVVEKSIEFARADQRAEILQRLTGQDERGESPVLGLMRDQYGNYVIQKILGQLKGQEREALVNQIKSQLVQLKRFSYGKQIIAIEKLIFDDQPNNSLSTSSQSSTLPSTNASTVEGPVAAPYHHDNNKFHETRIALPLATGSIGT